MTTYTSERREQEQKDTLQTLHADARAEDCGEIAQQIAVMINDGCPHSTEPDGGER